MKRSIAVAASALSIAALLAVAAAPSSAKVPNGQGLVDFGVFNCEGVGDVSVFGPRGPKAASSFTTTGEHVVLLSLSITGTDPVTGEPIDFSKTYGTGAGLTPVTCTQDFDGGSATAVVALVPPQ
jgi:hypothetical protein